MATQCRLDLSSHLQGGPITVRGGADWHQYAIAVAGVGALAGAAYALSNAGDGGGGGGGGGGVECSVTIGGPTPAEVQMSQVTLEDLAQSSSSPQSTLTLSGPSKKVSTCRTALLAVPTDANDDAYYSSLVSAAGVCAIRGISMTKINDPGCSVPLAKILM